MKRLRILITAGPTREHLDPVRFLSNGSTGRMGFAVAEAAAGRGHRVTLVAGPVEVPTPRGVRRVDVTSADEMARAVRRSFPRADALVMTAAVADFTPVKRARGKIRRAGSMTLRLKPTPDIVGGLAKKKGRRVIVGFALETGGSLAPARKKLRKKGLDVIVANTTKAMGSPRVAATLIFSDGRTEGLRPMNKKALGRRLIMEVERRCRSWKASSSV